MSETLEIRKKRLLHRSRYRGMRESDILMGQFAAGHLEAMSASELDQFERLLEEPDQDVLAWVYGQRPVPARHDHGLMRVLKSFRISL